MPTRSLVFRVRLPWTRPRAYSTRNLQRIDVRCGSGGRVSVDLFNDPKSSSRCLLVYLPPFPSADDSSAKIPSFLQGFPIASINYRWAKAKQAVDGHGDAPPLHWPAPVHETVTTFTRLMEALGLPSQAPRRDVYVYGSHLGATLAASLSLTEAHTQGPYSVRGFIGYNGIYDWTMFLPDHPLNSSTKPSTHSSPREPPPESRLYRLKKDIPGLFSEPTNLFDAFASPSLFFYSPGLHIPPSFTMTVEESARLKAKQDLERIRCTSKSGRRKTVVSVQDVIRAKARRSDDEQVTVMLPKKPRRSYLRFPPFYASVKVPHALLLYDSPWKTSDRSWAKAAEPSAHTFSVQAEQLANLMRHSVGEVELGGRVSDDISEEAQRRVSIGDVGPETGSVEMSESGQRRVQKWLKERM